VRTIPRQANATDCRGGFPWRQTAKNGSIASLQIQQFQTAREEQKHGQRGEQQNERPWLRSGGNRAGERHREIHIGEIIECGVVTTVCAPRILNTPEYVPGPSPGARSTAKISEGTVIVCGLSELSPLKSDLVEISLEHKRNADLSGDQLTVARGGLKSPLHHCLHCRIAQWLHTMDDLDFGHMARGIHTD
jgi:hypothetical protein